MPSDAPPHRLHPASVLFNLAGELKRAAVPFVLALLGARSADTSALFWAAVTIVGGTLAMAAGIVRHFTLTYAYEEDELVVRSGVFFKRERHIPYTRIQNIDATQNIAHALLGVYSVAIETGSGSEPEATLSVLPADALADMRRHVFDERRGPSAASLEPEPAAPRQQVLLRMGLRDLALCGLVRGRGLLLMGAIAGMLFDFGMDFGFDEAIEETAGNPQKRGPIVRAARTLVAGVDFNPIQLLAAAAVFLMLIAILRAASMIYTMQKLYGFTLGMTGEELRIAYGWLTRVSATIPVRRIQTVTVREGPLHRLFGMCSVRADTAGGEANTSAATGREWLAPIMPRAGLSVLLRALMPEADLDAVTWEPAHPRAFRRALVKRLMFVAIASLPLFWYFRLVAAPILMLMAATAVVNARLQVKHFGYAIAGEVFLFRSGWFWRHVTVAPLRKVQAVSLRATPFDRRHGMAVLSVDTAGAAGSPHRLHVPYLAHERAGTLAEFIAGRASQSQLSW